MRNFDCQDVLLGIWQEEGKSEEEKGKESLIIESDDSNDEDESKWVKTWIERKG